MEVTMQRTCGTNRGRFGALAFLVLALLVALPTPAFAQVDLDPTDKVDEAVDRSTDAVDDTVDTVEDAVDDATGSETVDETTDTVDEVTGRTGQTIDDTTDSVTDEVDRVTAPLQDTLDDTTGSVVDSLLGRNDRRARNDRATGPNATGSTRDSVRTDVRGERVGADDRSGRPVTGGRDVDTRPVSEVTSSRRLIENIGDIAAQVAFPLALLLLVAAFLIVQGRVDRDDPKLSLAPVDLESEYLSFR